TTGRVIPKAAVAGRGAVGARFLEEAARIRHSVLVSQPLPSLTSVLRVQRGTRAGSPAASAAGQHQRLHLPDQFEHAVPVALGAAPLQLALHLQRSSSFQPDAPHTNKTRPLRNPVALDFLKVFKPFLQLGIYLLILVSKDFDESCEELSAGLAQLGALG
ncbi:hypothetical protein MC885_006067, partial [Smutsia gigantea]